MNGLPADPLDAKDNRRTGCKGILLLSIGGVVACGHLVASCAVLTRAQCHVDGDVLPHCCFSINKVEFHWKSLSTGRVCVVVCAGNMRFAGIHGGNALFLPF